MKVHERFLKYVAFDTQSEESMEQFPSTEKQKTLAHALAQEMQAMGLRDVETDRYGYVYGTIPPSAGMEVIPVLGLIAHMDTSPEMPGKDIHPTIVRGYDGNDLVLNRQKDIVMTVSQYPGLSRYKGQNLIVTDGTTLLGADDKAGIAEILTAAEELLAGDVPHGAVRIAFTPDEEVGRGADFFDVKKFNAAFAFTVDGGTQGGIQYENFNASAAKVTVNGINTHPGDAKGKMVNAILVAMEFQAMLPVFDNPMYTQDREGFFHLNDISGSVEHTQLHYILRDHDLEKLRRRERQMQQAAAYLNEKYGQGTVELALTDSYRNMIETIRPHMDMVEIAKAAIENAGLIPYSDPIRGGTDGARLSFMGLPCPNLFTGGENPHGRFEFISIESMENAVRVLLDIIRMTGEKARIPAKQ